MTIYGGGGGGGGGGRVGMEERGRVGRIRESHVPYGDGWGRGQGWGWGGGGKRRKKAGYGTGDVKTESKLLA